MGKGEWFRINISCHVGCIMSSGLFNVYMERMMKEDKMGIGIKGVRFLEEGRE